MSFQLTSEQLDALRAMPLLEMPNKVRVAMAMVRAKQVDIVNAYPDLDPSAVHRVVTGKYSALELEMSRKFAEFLGCAIEDIFPPLVAAVERDQSPQSFRGKAAVTR